MKIKITSSQLPLIYISSVVTKDIYELLFLGQKYNVRLNFFFF